MTEFDRFSRIEMLVATLAPNDTESIVFSRFINIE